MIKKILIFIALLSSVGCAQYTSPYPREGFLNYYDGTKRPVWVLGGINGALLHFDSETEIDTGITSSVMLKSYSDSETFTYLPFVASNYYVVKDGEFVELAPNMNVDSARYAIRADTAEFADSVNYATLAGHAKALSAGTYNYDTSSTVNLRSDYANTSAYSTYSEYLHNGSGSNYGYNYWGRSLSLDGSTLTLNNSTGSQLSTITIPGVTSIGSPANGLSISGHTLSLGLASNSATGALSQTDWQSFNAKATIEYTDEAFNQAFDATVDSSYALRSAISQTANQISLNVTETNKVKDSVTVHRGEINVTKSNVNLKVSKNDVVNQINLSTEGIDIDANKINITGIVSFINSDGTSGTKINGNKIETDDLSAISATLGTVSGGTIKGSSFTTGEAFGGEGQVDVTGRAINMSYTSGNLFGNTIQAELIQMQKFGAGASSTSITADGVTVNGLSVLVSGVATASDISGLNATLSGKTTTSNLHLSGEGAPSGSPSNENMTYYDSANSHYYVNFGTGSWIRVQIL